ncbi:MAG TPA: MarR family transcriptional regulator [Streptosporangiaceae bacterium]|nr:MarR family transcriptional regulator [Streptosporangiaceae bacterium]
MGTRSRADDKLDTEILDAMSELIAGTIARGEQIAQRFGMPAFCLKAVHALAAPMAMRDLGKLMHCDPSFVTSIADLLEKRGLALREPSTADRRIKNLVLTKQGLALREKVEREFMAQMPWRALDREERTCLLALIRKMSQAVADDATESASTTEGAMSMLTPPMTGGPGAGEVSETLITG